MSALSDEIGNKFCEHPEAKDARALFCRYPPRFYGILEREKPADFGLQYLRPRLVKGGVSFYESNCLGPKVSNLVIRCHQGHAGICQQYSQFCPFEELNNERDADRINLAVVNVDAEMFYSLEDGMLVVWPTWWLFNPAGGR